MTNDNPKALESSEEIAAELSSIRREIDTVKAVVNKPGRPWYLDGSLILAGIAFLFSVYTYQRQDRNDTQVELRNVIRDLYSLPEQAADANLKFRGTTEEAPLSVGFNHQFHVLSLQAYALAEHLGRRLDIPECMAIANAIMGYEPELAEKMLTNAQIPSDDFEDLVAARQGLGAIQIVSGRTKQGDDNYQAAIDILKSPERHFDARSEIALTELRWAESYLMARNCPNAFAHLKTAQGEIKQLAGTPAAEMLKPQLEIGLAAHARCEGMSTPEQN